MIFSHSRLKTFDCPKRFYHKYILKEKEATGEPAFLGKVVHNACEAIINGEVPVEEFGAAVTKGHEKAVKEEKENGFGPPAVDLEVARGLVQQAQAKKDMGVAEEHFQIDLNPGDMFSPQIQGYIDVRISENAVEADHQQVVLDWKTNQATYEPTENNQLGLYAWAVSQQTGANAVLGILRFLRFKGKKGRKTKLFTQGDMEKARQWAMDRANDILARKSQLELGGDAEELFSANPKCGECKWCTVVKDCQAKSEAKEDSITKAVTRLDKNEMVITSHSEAEEVGAELLRLQAVSKKLTAALKEYSQETGQNIVVGDQEYGKKDSVSWTFTADQKKEIAKALIKEGVNPWNVFKLGSTELNDKEIIGIGWNEDTFKYFGGETSTRTNYKWAKRSKAKKGGKNGKIKKDTEKSQAS